MSDNISRTKSAILSLNSPGKGAAKSASHTPRTQTVSFFAKGGAVRFERGDKKVLKKAEGGAVKTAKQSERWWEDTNKSLTGSDKAYKEKKVSEAAKKVADEKESSRMSDYVASAKSSNKEADRMISYKSEAAKVAPSEKKQSFGDAFKAARAAQGAGGTFTYNGKKYSTNRADDSAVEATVKYNKKKDPSTEGEIRKRFASDLGEYKKGGKVKAKGDKKKVMGTVGEAKAIMAALKRPAVGTVPPPMGGGMPMKKGGKAKKKC